MKILLINEHTLNRKGLISLLSVQAMIEEIKEARNKEEALLLLKQINPDLVIVDYHLEEDKGLEVIREAREEGYTCKFAILTYSKDPKFFERARMMEVDGYISLNIHPEEFLYAIQVIQRGRKYYDPDVLDLFMNSPITSTTNETLLTKLTSKEKEILQKLGMGLTNREISERLFITENTVKKHVSQVLAKLELDDRTQAALYANEIGLVQYSSIIS